MDQLPLELLNRIFKLLSLNQLQICKKVNKKWYFMICELKNTKLVISDTWNFKGFWFYDYELIKFKDLIKIKSFEKYQIYLLNQFNNLKYLYLFSNKFDKGEYKVSNFINCLLQLENLSLDGLTIKKDENINLISLKTLNFNCKYDYNLIMNTPNLMNLNIGYGCDKQLTISFPGSIKYLHVVKLYSDYIENFTNLEYFYIEHIYGGFNNILSELPKLKELHFFSSDGWLTFNTLLRTKKQLNRIDFKPYFMGINFQETNYNIDYDSYILANEKNLKLFKKFNDRLADKLVFITTLNYNDYENLYDYNLNNLIMKFVNLKKIEILTNINHPNLFINLLKFLSESIETLSIESSNLNNWNFFNQLPYLIPILNCLSIKNEKQKLDFDFLIKFKSIMFLDVDQNLSNKIIKKMMAKFKDIRSLDYRDDNQIMVKISKDIFNNKTRFFKPKKIKLIKERAKSIDLNLDILFSLN